jgi:hypothetical protein
MHEPLELMHPVISRMTPLYAIIDPPAPYGFGSRGDRGWLGAPGRANDPSTPARTSPLQAQEDDESMTM